MGCPAEREMAIIHTANINTIGIGKAFGIPISSGHNGDGGLAFVNDLPPEFNIVWGQASGVLTGGLKPQQFLHSGRDQRQIAAYFLHHLRTVQQGEKTITDQVRRGLLAANHGNNAVSDYFFDTQTIPIYLCRQ